MATSLAQQVLLLRLLTLQETPHLGAVVTVVPLLESLDRRAGNAVRSGTEADITRAFQSNGMCL
jgi:hypothetical protein